MDIYFETERLILRKFDHSDSEAVFAIRSDAEMMRFIRQPQNQRESKHWIKLISSVWTTEKIGFCAVVEKQSQTVIGWCGLWRLKETGETEIGYAIRKDFWGGGLAVEAAEKILEYGFSELELEKIVAVARLENFSSRRVMEKLGMTFDHIGNYYDTELAHYTIKQSDYFKNRKPPLPKI